MKKKISSSCSGTVDSRIAVWEDWGALGLAFLVQLHVNCRLVDTWTWHEEFGIQHKERWLIVHT